MGTITESFYYFRLKYTIKKIPVKFKIAVKEQIREKIQFKK